MSTLFHPLTVRSIEPDTAEAVVVSFAVPAELRATFGFTQGQYLTLRHTIDVYAAGKNRNGISIEAAVRIWARQDANGLAVVEEVDAERLECTRRLFLALGMPPAEAAARSALLYAYVFGFSMMQCGRFGMDAEQTKRWIVERITQ